MAKALPIACVEQFSIGGDSTNLSIRWDRWLKSFHYYVVGSGITDKAQKRALLLHLVGQEVQQIFETLPDTGENGDYDRAVQRLTEYFKPRKNISFERHRFNSESQKMEESVTDFCTRLRHLAMNCEFTDTEDRIRDHIVQRCNSTQLRRRFLRETDLTLTKVLEIASANERADACASTMEQVKLEETNRVQARSGRAKQKQKESKKRIECYRCGRQGHKANDPKCPARSEKCRKCGKLGHFEKKCRSEKQKKKQVRSLEDPSNSESEEVTFSLTDKLSKTIVKVGNIPISMIIDSGASCNVIDVKTWNFLNRQKTFKFISKCKTQKKIFPYGSKKPLPLAGMFKAEVCKDDKCFNAEFLVLKGTGQSLLSCRTAIDLGVIQLINSVDKGNKSITDQFPGLFVDKIGKLKDYQLRIPIDDAVHPIVQQTRRIPYNLRGKLEGKLDQLEDMDIIEKVEGPTSWVSPVVVIPKKNGDIRLCVDMRQANTAVKRVRHPIPTLDDVLNDMNGSRIFSKLDISNAYHQIELSPNSRDITTFTTHKGLYRYKRLLFGVSCAPEMYQNILQQLLQGCEGVRNVMDDIIIHSKTREEHEIHLRKVLGVLQGKGLTLNESKCQFYMSKLEYMGHELSEQGIKPSKAKIEAVKNAREPKSATEVRSFLGLVNYNARYIPDFSTISAPLRELTKKNAKFRWNKSHQKAFKELKDRLCDAHALAYFDLNAPTKVIVDASPVGLGAVLLQDQKGESRVISYASRSLTDVERRYSQTEREALAVVWGLEHFNAYLYGIDFDLYTDHKPLEHIYSKKSKPCARIERWVLRLQPYSFKVKYLKGKDNIADALSRLLSSKGIGQSSLDEVDEIKLIASILTPSSMSTQDIESESQNDKDLCSIKECLLSGKWHLLENKAYLPIRHELCAIGHLVLRGTRIVIPTNLRQQVLELAHLGHPGIVVMKRNLRTKVWWPGIDKDAENFCKTCYGCQLVSNPLKPEPMVRTELPAGPWQDLALDLLGPLPSGDYIFVLIDYYSRFFEIKVTKSITSENMVKILQKFFVTHGLPLTLRTDNAKNFISEEFTSYLQNNGIVHKRTTPLYPQANGEVERQNQSIMKRVRISQAEGRNWKSDLDDYLLMYRSTPHSVTGKSPAEMLYGRQIRTKLPDLTNHRFERNDFEVRDRDSERKGKGKEYADRKRQASYNDIQKGDNVFLKQRRENKMQTPFNPLPHKVVEKHGNKVTIESQDGVRYDRNVTHVKPYMERIVENDRFTALPQIHSDAYVPSEGNSEKSVMWENRDKPKVEIPKQDNSQGRNRPERNIKPPVKYQDYVMNSLIGF